MALNPFEDAKRRDDRRAGDYSLGIARVVSVPDSTGHQIAIEPVTKTGDDETTTSPTGATVMVAQKGDISLPSEGDLVVFGRFKNRQSVVLGVVYSQQSTIREYDADERHVGREGGGGTYIHGAFGVVPRRSDDPDSPPDGAVWYREDLDEYRGVEGDTTVSFDTTTV